ncbi:nitrite reductase small subunit NirD [Gracilibacillus caseinilyticus]|uniref:Nitrite reductase small subunit NirD n=1 Tax=Gracilibacillus caseinilyticus TaxID=2932256 RepID=A0ABY4EUH2_9BACI|nr:nitrite reductase small subunit NirD [Gracilibacillus caseinilyticus]UOQ48067.1 nitrite reductase small subunit NirD [Gracilibacillus caseinilyticus]
MEQRTVGKVLIGNYEDLPVSLGKAVVVDDKELAVFRLSNGKVKAIENKCPHRGGVLSEGMVSGEHVFCPLHDWKINVSDGLVQAPDEGCVQTYKTTIEDNKVYVEITDQ